MLDDLRQQAAMPLEEEAVEPPTPPPRRGAVRIWGLSPFQTFLLALLLLLVTCLIGSLCLIATGRVVPFFIS